jgi:hypothetical protein
MEIEPRLGLADVETIITSPNFYRDGNAYFSGVWSQSQENCAEEQAVILQVLCQQPDGLSVADLTQRLEARHPVFQKHRVSEALNLLQRHDVISLSEGRYTFVVELMRRWVEQEKLNDQS